MRVKPSDQSLLTRQGLRSPSSSSKYNIESEKLERQGNKQTEIDSAAECLKVVKEL